MWQHRPLLLWAGAFAAGVASWAQVRSVPLAAAFCLAALGCLALAFGRRPGLLLLGLMLTGFGAGALRLAAFQTAASSDIAHWADGPSPVIVTGTVVSDPESRRGGRINLILLAERITVRGQIQMVTGDAYADIGGHVRNGAALDYGDRVTLSGWLETPPGATNPGEFSWRDYLARRAISCQLRVARADAAARLGASRLNPVLHLAWTVRRRILASVKSSLPPTEAAVLSGILLGKRTDLPPDLRSDFVHTGTVHILASAGLHVGIVAFWALWLCQKLTLPRKTSALAIIFLLCVYALMCGGRPAVTRAVVMGAIYFGAILFEREPDLPTTVACAALLILLLQPTALLEPGFQLSFATVLTLAVAMPVWDGFWRPRLQARIAWPPGRNAAVWAMEMAGLSLGAQLGSFPLVAGSYNEVSLLGWLANLLVVPLLFVLIPLAFSGAALWILWPWAGSGLLHLAGLGTGVISVIVRDLGESAWAARAIPTPSPLLILLFYALLYGALDALQSRWKITASP